MEKRIVSLALTLLAMAFATASVFAYYPFQLIVSPVEPPVTFELGDNANEGDLGQDKIIYVELGNKKASVEITINPTYQTTKYKSVVKIVNNEENGKAYSVWLILKSRNTGSFPSDFKVDLTISGRDVETSSITLTQINTNTPQKLGTLNAKGEWELGFEVYIPENFDINGKSATFEMSIAYTPSSEEPP